MIAATIIVVASETNEAACVKSYVSCACFFFLMCITPFKALKSPLEAVVIVPILLIQKLRFSKMQSGSKSGRREPRVSEMR